MFLSKNAFALVDMPSSTLKSYFPEEKESHYVCNGRKLDDLSEADEERAFHLYALNYNLANGLEIAIPYRTKIYLSMLTKLKEELRSDPSISKFEGESSTEKWVVPYIVSGVYSSWSNFLGSQKRKIESDSCLLKWYKSQNKKHSYIPIKFLEFYNSLYDSYQELVTRCEKPDIKGWTQDQSAKDYVNCRNSQWRRDHNKALRKLKSYKSLHKDFMNILEPLGKVGELKPVYSRPVKQ